MKKQRRLLNNKGFSLVELIIVIAIMAILVGVLAPSLLRYVEKTNVSADTQLADAVKTAVVTAMMDPVVVNSTDGSCKKFVDAHTGKTPVVSISSLCVDSFLESIAETLGMTSAADGTDVKKYLVGKLKSNHVAASADFLIDITGGNSVTVTITTTDSTGKKATTDETKYITVK